MKKCIGLFLLAWTMLCLSACESSNRVYICTGPEAFVWHRKKSCWGLDNCSGDIVLSNLDDLSSKYKRECKICY